MKTPPLSYPRITLLWVLVVLSVTATGCLSRRPLNRENFALTGPAEPRNDPAGRSVRMRNVIVNPLFEGQQLVYRLGPDRFERDPFAAWLVAPNQMLRAAILLHLSSSGLFREVVPSDGMMSADLVFEVYVSELFADFSDNHAPVAVLSMMIVAADFQPGAAKLPRLERNYSRRKPIAGRDQAAVVAAYRQALEEIMKQVAADLAALPAGGR